MSDFKAGLEAAAQFVELMQAEHQRVPNLAAMIRSLAQDAGSVGTSVAVIGAGGEVTRVPVESMLVPASAADEAFAQFRAAYKPLGFRNNWVAARKKFDILVKKEKIDPAVIVAGAIAYAQTRPEKQFVPAPEVFLNKRQFAYDWANSGARRNPSPNDIETYLQGRVGHE